MLEPRTPLDPCDRVKFILEKEEEGSEGGELGGSHSLFTELEELRCDHHNRWVCGVWRVECGGWWGVCDLWWVWGGGGVWGMCVCGVCMCVCVCV